MYRYDIYPGHRLEVQKRPRAKKSSWLLSLPCVGIKEHRPVLGRGSGSSHIDPNMLCAPRSGSFLAGNLAKLAAGDAPVTFYTNQMLT
jgi:hypothetical protein